MFRHIKLKAMIVIRIHMICQLSDRPLRRIFFILNFALRRRMMKKIVLMLGIIIGVPGYADNVFSVCVGATETTAGIDDVTGAHCGTCGTNCNWKIEGDTFKITGGVNGEIGTMNVGAKWIDGVYTYVMPWKNLKNEFSKVDIQGVSNVGEAAFRGFANITDIKMDDGVTVIGGYAFAGSKIKTVILPDSLKNLGWRAFSNDIYENDIEEIIISDSLSAMGDSPFGSVPEQLSDLKIICRGDKQKCQNVLSKHTYWDGSKPEGERIIAFNLAGNVISADDTNCNSLNYFWNGVACVREPDVSKRACCPVCADLDGYCSRIRYTLPEADEATSDDNENMIEWIFE